MLSVSKSVAEASAKAAGIEQTARENFKSYRIRWITGMFQQPKYDLQDIYKQNERSSSTIFEIPSDGSLITDLYYQQCPSVILP